jgi:hypothetical protein
MRINFKITQDNFFTQHCCIFLLTKGFCHERFCQVVFLSELGFCLGFDQTICQIGVDVNNPSGLFCTEVFYHYQFFLHLVFTPLVLCPFSVSLVSVSCGKYEQNEIAYFIRNFLYLHDCQNRFMICIEISALFVGIQSLSIKTVIWDLLDSTKYLSACIYHDFNPWLLLNL